jgi:hypothetical protein
MGFTCALDLRIPPDASLAARLSTQLLLSAEVASDADTGVISGSTALQVIHVKHTYSSEGR